MSQYLHGSPSLLSLFLWLSGSDRVPGEVLLDRRHVPGPGVCVVHLEVPVLHGDAGSRGTEHFVVLGEDVGGGVLGIGSGVSDMRVDGVELPPPEEHGEGGHCLLLDSEKLVKH
mmetsp:Transcript_41184/g.64347  ORF Transcript_41184/g.64347 Transcript_41184/m.64347 type:complete len:114 (+) Transcript_41184:46-387(+)